MHKSSHIFFAQKDCIWLTSFGPPSYIACFVLCHAVTGIQTLFLHIILMLLNYLLISCPWDVV